MAKKQAVSGNRSQAIRDYLATNPTATPNDVVAALKEQGIEVSANLVGTIKYRKAKKAVRRSVRRLQKANELAAAQPAKSGSQSIREYLAQNPSASPKEIVAGLHEQGIEVKPGLASLIKYTNRPGKERRQLRRAIRKGRIVAAVGGSISAVDILEAKKLADAVGGVENAKRALELLEQLR